MKKDELITMTICNNWGTTDNREYGDLISIDDLAKLVEVPANVLQKWASKGLLTAARLGKLHKSDKKVYQIAFYLKTPDLAPALKQMGARRA